MMKLTKPIINYDTESTGTDTEKDRIIQIAAIKIYPDGRREEKNVFINPTVPIPLEASEIHGITDEMVKEAPTFKQLAKGIKDWFEGCDIMGFNSNSYDNLILLAEMARAEVDFSFEGVNFLDVRQVFMNLYPNTLSDIYKRFLGKELEGAHDALNDLIAAEEILNYMLENNPDFPKTPQEIDEFLQGGKKRVDFAGKLYKDSEGIIRYNFGKSKDKPVKEDKGFGEWALKQNFPKDTKDKLKQILNG